MLDKLRKICLTLPETSEVLMHSHPAFRVKDKTFCIYHGEPGRNAVAIKVAKNLQSVFLEDSRFFKTPYIGKHGWISFFETQKVPAAELKQLIEGSYQLAAPKRKR